MKKQITSKHGIHTTEIERQDWSIRFYSFETNRHYTRKVWFSKYGADIYVQFGGKFWDVVTERDGRYNPWLACEYTEVK